MVRYPPNILSQSSYGAIGTDTVLVFNTLLFTYRTRKSPTLPSAEIRLNNETFAPDLFRIVLGFELA
jgi:hypothetical protein